VSDFAIVLFHAAMAAESAVGMEQQQGLAVCWHPFHQILGLFGRNACRHLMGLITALHSNILGG
jgi:hypothetical protein